MNEALLAGLLSAAATLAGVTVTLVTIVPVLIGALQSRSDDVFREAESRYRLQAYVRILVYALAMFSATCAASVIAILYRWAWATWLAVGMFLLGIATVVVVTSLIARFTHSLLSSRLAESRRL